MSISKQYLKTKPICKVTFKCDGEFVADAKTITLVGEFNNWNPKAHQMKRLKNGSFKLILDLKTGKDYQFRYLVNHEIWKNDCQADKYIRTPFGDADNCVVIV